MLVLQQGWQLLINTIGTSDDHTCTSSSNFFFSSTTISPAFRSSTSSSCTSSSNREQAPASSSSIGVSSISAIGHTSFPPHREHQLPAPATPLHFQQQPSLLNSGNTDFSNLSSNHRDQQQQHQQGSPSQPRQPPPQATKNTTSSVTPLARQVLFSFLPALFFFTCKT